MSESALNSPEISAIIPNFNHGIYIRDCIDALKNQKFGNFEAIIVDDKSTDNSVKIIRKAIKDDSRFKLITCKEQSGAIYSLNIGAKFARGNYLYFGAADDVTTEYFFLNVMNETNRDKDLALVSTLCVLVEDTNRRTKLRPLFPIALRKMEISPKKFARLMKWNDNWIITGASIIKKSVFDELGGFIEELGPFSDGYLVRQIGFTNKTLYLPAIGLVWRRSDQGLSVSAFKEPNKFNSLISNYISELESNVNIPNYYPKRLNERMQLIRLYHERRTTMLNSSGEKSIFFRLLFYLNFVSIMINRSFGLKALVIGTIRKFMLGFKLHKNLYER